MVEVIRSDYIRPLAQGAGRAPVILKHVLKNACIPVVTLSGPLFAASSTGSFFVESSSASGLGRFPCSR
jgi:oligopeptide transport system permease protein